MTRMSKILLTVPLLVVAAELAHAAPTDPPPTQPPTPTEPSTPASPPTSPRTGMGTAPVAAPSDAEIVHILVTANDIDIENGRLAKRRSNNPAVQTFAERMITDHTALKQQVTDLTGRLDLTPADNATSQALKQDHTAAAAALKDLEGAAFDKAYIDQEVTLHATLVDQVDRVLIPNAKNAELKTLVEGARPVLAAHLEHAKQVQQQLGVTPSAPAAIVY
jgi:putative membrane protein